MFTILSRKEYQALISENRELFDDNDQLARENDRLRMELKNLHDRNAEKKQRHQSSHSPYI